jgi:hypothetical protein
MRVRVTTVRRPRQLAIEYEVVQFLTQYLREYAELRGALVVLRFERMKPMRADGRRQRREVFVHTLRQRLRHEFRVIELPQVRVSSLEFQELMSAV